MPPRRIKPLASAFFDGFLSWLETDPLIAVTAEVDSVLGLVAASNSEGTYKERNISNKYKKRDNLTIRI